MCSVDQIVYRTTTTAYIFTPLQHDAPQLHNATPFTPPALNRSFDGSLPLHAAARASFDEASKETSISDALASNSTRARFGAATESWGEQRAVYFIHLPAAPTAGSPPSHRM